MPQVRFIKNFILTTHVVELVDNKMQVVQKQHSIEFGSTYNVKSIKHVGEGRYNIDFGETGKITGVAKHVEENYIGLEKKLTHIKNDNGTKSVIKTKKVSTGGCGGCGNKKK